MNWDAKSSGIVIASVGWSTLALGLALDYAGAKPGVAVATVGGWTIATGLACAVIGSTERGFGALDRFFGEILARTRPPAPPRIEPNFEERARPALAPPNAQARRAPPRAIPAYDPREVEAFEPRHAIEAEDYGHSPFAPSTYTPPHAPAYAAQAEAPPPAPVRDTREDEAARRQIERRAAYEQAAAAERQSAPERAYREESEAPAPQRLAPAPSARPAPAARQAPLAETPAPAPAARQAPTRPAPQQRSPADAPVPAGHNVAGLAFEELIDWARLEAEAAGRAAAAAPPTPQPQQQAPVSAQAHAAPQTAPARPAYHPAPEAPANSSAPARRGEERAPIEEGEIGGRPYRLYADLTVEVDTLLGRRGFESMEAASRFVGAREAPQPRLGQSRQPTGRRAVA